MRIVLGGNEGEKLTFRLRGLDAVVAEPGSRFPAVWGALKYRKSSEAVYYDSVSDLRRREQTESYSSTNGVIFSRRCYGPPMRALD